MTKIWQNLDKDYVLLCRIIYNASINHPNGNTSMFRHNQSGVRQTQTADLQTCKLTGKRGKHCCELVFTHSLSLNFKSSKSLV